MADYIKRDTAISIVNTGYYDIHDIRFALKTIPALEIIHCVECKYNNACFTQAFVESESKIPFDRNTWFCADGARKE